MTNGWNGSETFVQQNEPGIDYELATRYSVTEDIDVTHIRVNTGLSASLPGRAGRIWSTGGTVLASAGMPNSLIGGWTSHALSAPLQLVAGATVDVSYSTLQYYNAVLAPGYPVTSIDGAVTATGGRFNNDPGVFPNSATGAFYGIDLVYTIGGNLPPVVGLAVSSAGLTGIVNIAVEDEAPGAVSYSIFWGDGAVTNTTALTAQHVYSESGYYPVLVIATDAGGEVGAASEVMLILGPPAGKELDVQRRTTRKFIDARPTLLSLIPRAEVKDGGGVRTASLAPRPPQTVRLIEVTAGAGPVVAADGFQDQNSFQLLMPWDGSVGLKDYWVDVDGVRWEVTDILPHNGYEVRAEVTRFGSQG